MSKRVVPMLALMFCALLSWKAPAQELPYKEGPVVDVGTIRVKDGKFYDYWSYLESHWRPLMEEAKKQGWVLNYAVYSAFPRTPQEPNLILVVTYPNMAALDGMDARLAALEQKLFSASPQKSETEYGARESIRTVIGDELIRELQFKK